MSDKKSLTDIPRDAHKNEKDNFPTIRPEAKATVSLGIASGGYEPSFRFQLLYFKTLEFLKTNKSCTFVK
jgi:hypothetical protein